MIAELPLSEGNGLYLPSGQRITQSWTGPAPATVSLIDATPPPPTERVLFSQGMVRPGLRQGQFWGWRRRRDR